MNVAQLIAQLQTYPPFYEVVVSKNCNGDCFSPVEKVGDARFIPWDEPPFNSHIGEVVPTDSRNKNCVFIVPEA
jgi:hypothetical protein